MGDPFRVLGLLKKINYLILRLKLQLPLYFYLREVRIVVLRETLQFSFESE